MGIAPKWKQKLVMLTRKKGIVPETSRMETEDKSSNKNNYGQYVRPLTAKLMKAFQLDIAYEGGEGNWLYYQGQKVLDATGGYGANLLGHRNKHLLEVLISSALHGTPSNVQGSIRSKAGDLAKKMSSLLEQETKVGPWVTHFSNSGTEAAEAALKHSLIYYFNKIKNLSYFLNETNNKAQMSLKGPGADKFHPAFLQYLNTTEIALPAKILTLLKATSSMQEALEIIGAYNLQTLDRSPYLVSFEGGFHGKTIGSLKVTANAHYGQPFFIHKDRSLKTILLPRGEDQAAEIRNTLKSKHRYLITLELGSDQAAAGTGGSSIGLRLHPFSPIAGLIVEPIQGEAGIYEMPYSILSLLRRLSLEDDYLLIFDDIQSGLYRTGTLSAGSPSGAAADIYCFSKGLGGGLAKIGATSIISHKYIQDFGLLHTSTFAEDDLSSSISLRVLDILTGTHSPVPGGMKAAQYLKEKLLELSRQYPLIIKEVRGQGLMLAIEFSEELRTACFEFKLFCDAGMIGYLFASSLLHHDQLRIAPTLSNPYCLRMEPSLYLTIEECDVLLRAMRNMVEALQQLNMKYFLSPLFPDHEIGPAGFIKMGTIHYDKAVRPMAVFLSHAIDIKEFTKTLKSLGYIPKKVLFEKFQEAQEAVSFGITYRGILNDKAGRELEFVLLSLPLPSEIILNLFQGKNRAILIDKIQEAVQYAKELGACTVGLGQFTSIVTKNGFHLDSMGMTLTTGNAYTCALSIEATLEAAKEKNVDLFQSTIACVGATGNIVSVSAALLSEHCHHLSLVYHTPLEKSQKFQTSLGQLLLEIMKSKATSPCVLAIKKCLQEDFPRTAEDLLRFMEKEDVKKHLSAKSNLDDLKEAHIVVTGTNSAGAIIEAEHLRQGAIVVDIGVPRNVSEKVVMERKDIVYIMGGIAHLPQHETQGLDLDFFPLKKGEVFACMAETITLGFFSSEGEDKRYLHLGPISKALVEKIHGMAAQVGFTLGRIKKAASF